MCRLDLVVAVLLLPNYLTANKPEPILTDDSTQNPFEVYDTQSSEEFFDPMKQSYRSYQDFLQTNAREYYLPETMVTVPIKSTSEIDDFVEEEYEQTSTINIDHPTTVVLHSKTSDSIHDLIITKDLEDIDNSSQVPYAAELTSNKHGKMFVSTFDPAEIPHLHIYSENSLQNEKNDTDTEFNIDDADNENQTSTTPIPPISPITMPLIFKNLMKNIETTTSTHIYKFSADEILRKFLEDSYIRTPMAALIDTAPEALRKARILWKAALRPNAALDIVLVAYNSSGVGVTYSFKNTRTMVAGLDSVQESNRGESGGSAFYGIMRASELIPYDSAIFVSTDSIPLDTNLAQFAAITLLKKRIRLYLIWFGPQATDDNETLGQNSEGGVLGEVALRSGGEILRVTEEALGPNGDLGLITLFLRNGIQGAHELEIPVDTTVSSLQIKLQGNVDTATLDTPIGG